MREENKNIKLNSSEESKQSLLMQNDELVIKPIGVDGDKDIKKIQSTGDPKHIQGQSLGQAQGRNASKGVHVVAKPESDGKKNVFDVRLKSLSGDINRNKQKKVVKAEEKPLQLFIFRKLRTKSFFASFVVTVSFMLFSAVLFGVSVFADISYDSYKSVSVHEGVSFAGKDNGPVREGQVIDTTGTNGVVMSIGERGIIRLGENTVVTLESEDDDSHLYEFNLKKGSLWGNSLFDESSFVVKTDYSNLYAPSASFSVVVDNLKTDIYSDKHDVRVDLVADNEVINTLWIAQGNQAQILHSKIRSKKETIKKLLYSKLIKEFSYGRLNDKKKKESPWITFQLANDISYYNTLETAYMTDVNNRGLRTIAVGSLRSQAKSFLSGIQSILTFNQNKKDKYILDALFENVNDAQYLFLQGDDVDGNIRLSLFNNDINETLLSADTTIKAELFKKLNEKYYELSLFSPGDELFSVKQAMFKNLTGMPMTQFLNITGDFDFLTAKLNDVYEALGSGSVDLNELFSEYFDLYAKYTKPYAEKMDKIGDQVIRQNILVDNLLFQTPELYKLDFFDQKKKMEGDYLLALSSGTDKKEQRQTFISNDIDLLSRVRYFLFKDRLDTADARQIVYRLIKDIEVYQEGTVDIAAVNDLFNRRLADFGVFWEYLQATEYSSGQLHGASHSERFEAFKKIQEQTASFDDIRKEILGGTEISQESVTEITKRVIGDLDNAEIYNVQLGTYTDASKTKIPILSARVSGIKFRATYDWDRQLLSNIIVGNLVISQDGVKLIKAKKFIAETMTSLSRAEEKQNVVSVSNKKDELADVKRVAKVFLAEKFSKMGIVITTEDVELIDLDAGHYKVNNVYFTDRQKAVFSFEYRTGDDKVSNLVIKTKKGDKRVGDTFPSLFINDLVLKIYDESS